MGKVWIGARHSDAQTSGILCELQRNLAKFGMGQADAQLFGCSGIARGNQAINQLGEVHRLFGQGCAGGGQAGGGLLMRAFVPWLRRALAWPGPALYSPAGQLQAQPV